LFLRFWHPRNIWRHEVSTASGSDRVVSEARPSGRAPSQEALPDGRTSDTIRYSKSAILRAWLPWIILSIVVFIWGLPQTKMLLDGISAPKIPVPGLDKLVLRVPPVVAKPAAENAIFNFNWLSEIG